MTAPQATAGGEGIAWTHGRGAARQACLDTFASLTPIAGSASAP
jgi:hypothetical protein